MFGMVEVGGRLGLGVEALHVGVGGQLAGQDHLEGDDAIEADLPGLVDDAHAAAGDLLQQLVVAEIAHRPQRCSVSVGVAAGRRPSLVLAPSEAAQAGGTAARPLIHPLLGREKPPGRRPCPGNGSATAPGWAAGPSRLPR